MATTELADNEHLFTSESVTEGHPDKMADQISDGILDAVLAEDPLSRVACETLVNTGLVVVSGEITTKAYVDVPKIARDTIRRIGYDNADYGFDCDACAVITAIDEQSPDIAQGVTTAFEKRTNADDDEAGVDQRLAGDAPVGVLGQHGVQDPVGDLVGHLVRVALRDGLGGEEVLVVRQVCAHGRV